MNLVVKLGGSLMTHSVCEWTEILGRPGGRSRLVVPGGGIFAETVRQAQMDASRRARFSHATAHDMAILGMHQFGLVLSENLPEYRRLLTVKQVTEVATGGQATENCNGLWLPDPHDLHSQPDIVASWDMTSDAFSVWIAAQANIKEVVLVYGFWALGNTPGFRKYWILDFQYVLFLRLFVDFAGRTVFDAKTKHG